MARKKKHEDHANHEAWAIPYGDLITLLLAFFVVMYAISSVNEGKFRALSDSLQSAFRGTPKTLEPVQIGEQARDSSGDITKTFVERSIIHGQPSQSLDPVKLPGAQSDQPVGEHPITQQLAQVANELETALKSLVDADLVQVRRHEFWLEVEVRTDILFPSGAATLSDKAIPALDALADTLRKYPNPVRVEGHTDDRPISTPYYKSNWELSAARAASVVHRFARNGVSPQRLSVIGFGEFRPAQPNTTVAGRVANRRVVIVILAGDGAPAPADAAEMATEAAGADSPAALPPLSADPAPVNAITPPTARVPMPGTEPARVSAALGTGAGIPARE